MNDSPDRAGPAALVRMLLLWMAVGFAFILPALANGQPLLFPDSVGYYRSGEATLEMLAPSNPAHGIAAAPGKIKIDTGGDGVSTQRSPFYGLPVAIAEFGGGQWLLIVVQIAVAVAAIGTAARRFGVRGRLERAGIVALLGLVAGIGVFASTVMPDIFAGLMLLAIALLLTQRGEMGRRERAFWLAIILFSALAHKGHLAIAALALLAGCVLLMLARAVEWRGTAAIAAALLLAALGHGAVHRTVEQITGEPPISTPFLLARMIGDGTVPRYLDAHCATPRYRLCRYVDRMPMTENEFLWSDDPRTGVMGTVPAAERARISAEQGAIVWGALAAYPADQAAATARNIVRQLAMVGVTEFGLTSGLEPSRAPGMADTLTRYRDTAAMSGLLPLHAMSAVFMIVYFGSALALAVLAWRDPSRFFGRSANATAQRIIVAGVIVNAAVSGAISGVFDRYQGRVAWLLPFLLLAWILAHHRHRAEARQPREKVAA